MCTIIALTLRLPHAYNKKSRDILSKTFLEVFVKRAGVVSGRAGPGFAGQLVECLLSWSSAAVAGGISTGVVCLLPKQETRVRVSYPAPSASAKECSQEIVLPVAGLPAPVDRRFARSSTLKPQCTDVPFRSRWWAFRWL